MTAKLALIPPPLAAGDQQPGKIFTYSCRCKEQAGGYMGNYTGPHLAAYDASGRIFLRCPGYRGSGDRLFHVVGTVHAFCPECGAGHVLDSATIRQEQAR
jgi:hypothetical protein